MPSTHRTVTSLLNFFQPAEKKEVIKLGNGSSLPSDINNIYLLRSNKKLYDDAIKMMTF